jgi:hypothetical protein
MQEKTFEAPTTAPAKERFEFVLSVNGNIICQRNFAINNFQEKSLGSVHLTDAVMACVDMIDRDLREKTDIYNYLTAPQVFNDEAEMNWWIKNQPFKLDVPSFVVLRDSEKVYVWNGTGMDPYNKPFNCNDYAGERNDTPCVLKFAFLDNGEEVRSVQWDGNKYPKFVRTNIDIINQKNKYEGEGIYAPFEAFIINAFNKDRRDLTPSIKWKLSFACSGETVRYFSRIHYGDREYDLNLKGYNERLFLGLKKKK